MKERPKKWTTTAQSTSSVSVPIQHPRWSQKNKQIKQIGGDDLGDTYPEISRTEMK